MRSKEEEKIPEPTGCFVCGENSGGFTYCVKCGVEKCLEENDDSDPIA